MTGPSDPLAAFQLGGESLTARTVTIGETTFTFNKMLPLEGFRLLEEIRVAVKNIAEVLGGNSGGIVIGELVGAVPIDIIIRTRSQLFQFVSFTRPNIPTPMVLGKAEEAAFDGLEPAHIYEVWARALAVNFSGSLVAFTSRWSGRGAGAGTPQWKPET